MRCSGGFAPILNSSKSTSVDVRLGVVLEKFSSALSKTQTAPPRRASSPGRTTKSFTLTLCCRGGLPQRTVESTTDWSTKDESLTTVSLRSTQVTPKRAHTSKEQILVGTPRLPTELGGPRTSRKETMSAWNSTTSRCSTATKNMNLVSTS